MYSKPFTLILIIHEKLVFIRDASERRSQVLFEKQLIADISDDVIIVQRQYCVVPIVVFANKELARVREALGMVPINTVETSCRTNTRINHDFILSLFRKRNGGILGIDREK